jgi:hypothetical protein
MTTRFAGALLLSAASLCAQTTVFFPSDHAGTEGSTNERRLPLTNGSAARTQMLYEGVDLLVPGGAAITHLGFRQDGTIPSLGTTLDLQVFIGPTAMDAASVTNNFANNYSSPPTEVFTRKIYVLPDLGNPLNPNPNGNLVVIPLDVPFPYTAGENLIVEYRVHGNGQGAAFNYQIDEGTYRSTNGMYGQGCTGSDNRVPRLTGPTTNAPVPGTWTLNFSLGLPNSIAVMFVSFDQTPPNPILQVLGAPGCDVFISTANMQGFTSVTSGSGAFNRSFTVPNDANLNDLNLHAQTIVLDVAANNAGLVVSNAYHTQLGMTPRMTTIAATSISAATGSVARNHGIVSLFRYQ